MTKTKNTAFLICSIIILTVSMRISATYTPLFWEQAIVRALNDRDSYYSNFKNPSDKKQYPFWKMNSNNRIGEQLEIFKDEQNPWYHFLNGIHHSNSSAPNAVVSFDSAISLAQNYPGVLWVLFLEFFQAEQKEFTEKCLSHLEKQRLASGAQSIPAIAQQLHLISQIEAKRGNTSNALRLYTWSSRFERIPLWQTFSQAMQYLPKQPALFLHTIKNCFVYLAQSWHLQLSFAYYAYQLIRYFVFCLTFIIILIVMIPSLPRAVHPIADLFPLSINSNIRSALGIIIFFSLALFGLFPFLLLLSMMLWPHITKSRQKLFSVALVGIILFPVDIRIQEMFRTSLSNDCSTGLYKCATLSGWHPTLEKNIKEYADNHKADYLIHLAAAIIDLKRNNMESAKLYIQKAEKLSPAQDPVVLITAGNIYFSNGNHEKARNYYQTCIDYFPDNAIALFNLAQLNLQFFNTADGTELVTKSANIKPNLINKFIEQNDFYFSQEWPTLRNFIQPYYKPNDYWIKVFPDHCGSWKSSAKMWGSTFFGSSPLLGFSISIVLFIAMFTLQKKSSLENYFYCKSCGILMCRKCRMGPLCQDCNNLFSTTFDEITNRNLKLKIKNRKIYVQKLIICLLNTFLPGAGNIYKKERITILNILSLISTSFVFAIYLSLFSFNFSYPFQLISKYFLLIGICFLMITLYHATKSIKNFYKELKIMRITSGT